MRGAPADAAAKPVPGCGMTPKGSAAGAAAGNAAMLCGRVAALGLRSLLRPTVAATAAVGLVLSGGAGSASGLALPKL